MSLRHLDGLRSLNVVGSTVRNSTAIPAVRSCITLIEDPSKNQGSYVYLHRSESSESLESLIRSPVTDTQSPRGAMADKADKVS